MKVFLLLLLVCFFFFPSIGRAQIVHTKNMYTYEALMEDVSELSQMYPDLITYKSLTTTTYGRKVWAIKLGHGETSIFINGAHHAREWMTSTLLMKMIETYAKAYKANLPIHNIHPNILDHVSVWFVPMVNPDGVTLQQFGLEAFPSYIHPSLIEMNEGSLDFKRWKANGNGIDLNRQYPTNWENLKGVSTKPSYQFYKGNSPLQAEEVKALVDFTSKLNPEIAVAYHSSGNVLFWGFHQFGLTHTINFADDYYKIAQKVSDITNYRIQEPASHQQGGGYTDWFVAEFGKPGFTAEIGSLIKDNSLPLVAFPKIWERNKAIGLFLATKALERQKEAVSDDD
jgi:g-D-glutamyl-meso-diaminopimelate peptidase